MTVPILPPHNLDTYLPIVRYNTYIYIPILYIYIHIGAELHIWCGRCSFFKNCSDITAQCTMRVIYYLSILCRIVVKPQNGVRRGRRYSGEFCTNRYRTLETWKTKSVVSAYSLQIKIFISYTLRIAHVYFDLSRAKLAHSLSVRIFRNY